MIAREGKSVNIISNQQKNATIITCFIPHILLGDLFKVIPQYCIAHPLLRTILASLARVNERVHVHNERNFPQAKLDSEIRVRFLLNEHSGLYFYCILLYGSVSQGLGTTKFTNLIG